MKATQMWQTAEGTAQLLSSPWCGLECGSVVTVAVVWGPHSAAPVARHSVSFTSFNGLEKLICQALSACFGHLSRRVEGLPSWLQLLVQIAPGSSWVQILVIACNVTGSLQKICHGVKCTQHLLWCSVLSICHGGVYSAFAREGCTQHLPWISVLSICHGVVHVLSICHGAVYSVFAMEQCTHVLAEGTTTLLHFWISLRFVL